MKSYLLSLIAASLIAAFVGILAPEGERGGISKYMKLLTALFLVCVLIAPLQGAIEGLKDLINGNISIPGIEDSGEEDYRTEMNVALDSASETYFLQMLTQTLCAEFSIPTDELRCKVTWNRTKEEISPVRVTVILSGTSIWKDPHAIESFVVKLLGCECITAIE